MALHSNIGLILCRKHSLMMKVRFHYFSQQNCDQSVFWDRPCQEIYNTINRIISMSQDVTRNK